MALHRVGHTNSEGTLQAGDMTWNEAFGVRSTSKPKAKAGDRVEVLPGPFTGQDYEVYAAGAPGAPVVIEAADPTNPPTFDGQYKFPSGAVNPRSGASDRGLIEIHTPYVDLGGFKLINSRGMAVRGLGKADARLAGLRVHDFDMDGLRTAAIRFDFVDGYEADHNKVRDAGNHRADTGFGDPETTGGWPMVINAVASTKGRLHHNLVRESWGEGVNVSRGCSDAEVDHNIIFDTMGIASYIHGAQRVLVHSNLVYCTGDPTYMRNGFAPDGIVVNPGEIQYATGPNQQPLTAADVWVFCNVVGGEFHNYALWAGGQEWASDIGYALNVSLEASSYGKQKIGANTGKPVPHAGYFVNGTNIKNIRFLYNASLQADGQHRNVDGSDQAVSWIDNQFGVPLVYPVMPTLTDVDQLDAYLLNYMPVKPLTFDLSALPAEVLSRIPTGWFGRYVVPPPAPTMEHIGLMLEMDVDADKAAMIRQYLKSAKVTVS